MSGVDIWNETPVKSVKSAMRNPNKMYGLKDDVPLMLNPVKRSDTGSEAHIDAKFVDTYSTNPMAFRDIGPTPGGRKKKSLKNKKNGNRKTSKRKSRKSSIRKTKTRKHRK